METLWHVLSVIASLSVPFIAWLGKSYLDLNNRIVQSETRLEERTKIIESVREKQSADGNRLTQVEGHVESFSRALSELRQSSETRHNEIRAKLDILPRLDESLNNLARVCATIVPRELQEAKFEAQDARIRILEEKNK